MPASELAEAGLLPGASRPDRDRFADRLDTGGRAELDPLPLAEGQSSGPLFGGARPPPGPSSAPRQR
jgi:hypothetical protein